LCISDLQLCPNTHAADDADKLASRKHTENSQQTSRLVNIGVIYTNRYHTIMFVTVSSIKTTLHRKNKLHSAQALEFFYECMAYCRHNNA